MTTNKEAVAGDLEAIIQALIKKEVLEVRVLVAIERKLTTAEIIFSPVS